MGCYHCMEKDLNKTEYVDSIRSYMCDSIANVYFKVVGK